MGKGKTLSFRNAKTVYLYPDNHAIIVFEKRDYKRNLVQEWVEIVEKFIISGMFERPNDGRIIFSHNYNECSLAQIVRKAKCVRLIKNNSTEAAKKLGLEIQSLEVQTSMGTFQSMHIDHLIHGEFNYQPENADVGRIRTEKFDEVKDKSFWSDYQVRCVWREPKDETATNGSPA